MTHEIDVSTKIEIGQYVYEIKPYFSANTPHTIVTLLEQLIAKRIHDNVAIAPEKWYNGGANTTACAEGR